MKVTILEESGHDIALLVRLRLLSPSEGSPTTNSPSRPSYSGRPNASCMARFLNGLLLAV